MGTRGNETDFGCRKNLRTGLAWDSNRLISKELKSELTFWRSSLSVSNGVEFNTSPVITKVIYKDTSEYAYGGFIAEKLGNVIAQGNFSKPESSTNITYRELLAVKNVFHRFQKS